MIEITSHKIDVSRAIEAVKHPEAGGIDVFIGTTRNITKGKSVRRLEFECYEPMAKKELGVIMDRAKSKWNLLKYVVIHRIGTVEIGEEAVVIAVSGSHRDAAFMACRFIIDELKKTVPIWKKEIFEDGEVWVAAHP